MSDAVQKPMVSTIPLPTGALERETDDQWESEETFGKVEIDLQDGMGEMPRHGLWKILKTIVISNYKSFPKRMLKDIIWVGPLAVIWILLWTMGGMGMYTLPGPIRTLAWLGIFLTATYNGFLGKAAFVTVFSRTFIPLMKGIAKGERKTIGARYKKTWKLILNLIQTGKSAALKIMLMSAGVGLIASNLLTRNNKIDKYFICLLCATALFDDLSKGQGSMVVKLTSAALRDLPMLFGKAVQVNMRTTYLTLSGFAAGLVLAIVPGQFVNSFYSPVGAIFGAVVLIAGIVLHFVGGKDATRP
jgi:hypothetical protein